MVHRPCARSVLQVGEVNGSQTASRSSAMITRRRGAVGDNVPSVFTGGSPHEKVPKKAARGGDGCPVEDHNWRTKSETTGHCSSQFLDNTASFKHTSLGLQKTSCQRTELGLQMVKVIGVERRCLECCQQAPSVPGGLPCRL